MQNIIEQLPLAPLPEPIQDSWVVQLINDLSAYTAVGSVVLGTLIVFITLIPSTNNSLRWFGIFAIILGLLLAVFGLVYIYLVLVTILFCLRVFAYALHLREKVRINSHIKNI